MDIRIFQAFPVNHTVGGLNNLSFSTLSIHGVHIPGNITVNTVALGMFFSSAASKTATMSFGVYSLNGATLSLENSGSLSSSHSNTFFSVLTLAMSKTDALSAGNWYFGCLISTSGTGGVQPDSGIQLAGNSGPTIPGTLAYGLLSVSTGALPATIAESDIQDSPTISYAFPNIIISA